jgi:lysozyme
MVDLDKLTTSIKAHEGFRQFPYTDTTGHMTIGYGRNLSAQGVSDDEASYLLKNNIDQAISDAQAKPWWACVSGNDARARAFIEIGFNIGFGTMDGFSKALDAAMRADWNTCAAEFLDSLWARQVGQRAITLTRMIATGQDQ